MIDAKELLKEIDMVIEDFERAERSIPNLKYKTWQMVAMLEGMKKTIYRLEEGSNGTD